MKQQVSHPGEEQLLRYVDGELPARQTGRIRSHLEACWQCRTELGELEKSIGECVRYRAQILAVDAVPPPRAWADMYGKFAEADARVERRNWFESVLHGKTWAAGALAALMAVVIFLQVTRPPAIQAAELLQKAVVRANERPERTHRLQIRTKSSRNVGSLAPVSALFLAAHYPVEDPLSAHAYKSWHDQLPSRNDSVVEEANTFVIHTTSDSNELTAATLTLDRADLRPIQERLEFRNQEWVEITDLGEGTQPADQRTSIAPEAAVPSTVKSSIPAEATPASAGEELQVLATLHRMGADLGDPIEVTRTGSEILVSGVGLSPKRQAEISNAVQSMPHVVVRFSNGGVAAKASPGVHPQDGEISPAIAQLQSELTSRVGGRVQFDEMTARALDLSEGIMSRSYAIRRLAARFTPEVESTLDPSERATLDAILHDHSSALEQQAADLTQTIQPVLSLAGGAPAPVSDGGPWQSASAKLLESARRMEMLLAAISGSSTQVGAGSDLPVQLKSNLAVFRGALITQAR